MPLKKSAEEIEKVWTAKATSPEAMKARTEDVAEVTKSRLKRVVRYIVPINETVRGILDRHGITGARRLDFYNFARKVWWLYYDKGEEKAEKLVEYAWAYHKTVYDLPEDIMKEIFDAIKPHALMARAEELARQEAERKAFLAGGANMVAGDAGGSSEVGDNSPSEDSGAVTES